MLLSSCGGKLSVSWSRNFLPWMEQPESTLSWFKEPVTEMCSKQRDSSQLSFLLVISVLLYAGLSLFKVFLPSRFVYENVHIFYLIYCCMLLMSHLSRMVFWLRSSSYSQILQCVVFQGNTVIQTGASTGDRVFRHFEQPSVISFKEELNRSKRVTGL